MAAGLEDEVVAGLVNFKEVTAVALSEEQAVERCARRDDGARGRACFPVGEDVDGSGDGRVDRNLSGAGGKITVEGNIYRHDDDIEFVGIAVVVMVRVIGLPVGVVVIMGMIAVGCVPLAVLVAMPFIAMSDFKRVGAGGEGVAAGPFEGILGLEEFRIYFDGASEVEATDIENVIKVQRALGGTVDFGDLVDPVEAGFQSIELGRRQ